MRIPAAVHEGSVELAARGGSAGISDETLAKLLDLVAEAEPGAPGSGPSR
ncbi:hypothetical protein ACWGJ2_21060 [Streptomyces sp. NPDC054796]